MPMRRSMLVIALLALATLLGGAGRTVARDATPQTATPELIAAYESALNAHDPEAVAALYTDDATVTEAVQDGSTFNGRDAIEAWIAANFAGIPDLTVTTESVVSEGNRIAWAWVYHGSYTGEYSGLPPGQGQQITLPGASFLDLREGKIASETIYFDNRAFLTQVGALGTPSANAGSDTGSVMIRVYTCPVDLIAQADQRQPERTELLAMCTLLDNPDAWPTLRSFADDTSIVGMGCASGGVCWNDLPLGSYAMAGGETPPGVESMLVTDGAGNALQNPVVLLETATGTAEYDIFYFVQG
jgi:steroid delta-isomerase-like uncharacterized protein